MQPLKIVNQLLICLFNDIVFNVLFIFQKYHSVCTCPVSHRQVVIRWPGPNCCATWKQTETINHMFHAGYVFIGYNFINSKHLCPGFCAITVSIVNRGRLTVCFESYEWKGPCCQTINYYTKYLNGSCNIEPWWCTNKKAFFMQQEECLQFWICENSFHQRFKIKYFAIFTNNESTI